MANLESSREMQDPTHPAPITTMSKSNFVSSFSEHPSHDKPDVNASRREMCLPKSSIGIHSPVTMREAYGHFVRRRLLGSNRKDLCLEITFAISNTCTIYSFLSMNVGLWGYRSRHFCRIQSSSESRSFCNVEELWNHLSDGAIHKENENCFHEAYLAYRHRIWAQRSCWLGQACNTRGIPQDAALGTVYSFDARRIRRVDVDTSDSIWMLNAELYKYCYCLRA